MSKLMPDSWTTATIGSVTSETTQRVPEKEEMFSYVDIASIDRDKKVIATPQRLLGKDAPSRARKVIQSGDVLVSMTRPNLNAVAYVPAGFDGQIASTGFDVLRSSIIDPRWLFYLVRTADFVEKMSSLVQGALYPAIRSKDIRAYEAPLAPLDEQHRITNKLDAMLKRVDECREKLDRLPLILKLFRQSVLSAATSGALTEDWREKTHAPGNWRRVELSTLISEGPKNGLYKHTSCYGQGTRILRIDRFYDGEILPWEDTKRLEVTYVEENEFGLRIGDIVINRVNSPDFVGKSALVRNLPEPCVFESNMMRLRVDHSQILPEYCIRYLCSPRGLGQLRLNVKHAVNQSSINQMDVKAVLVELPPLIEQQEIVDRIHKLFGFADRLEARYLTCKKQVDQLTPSLLAKAFRGELVEQDPNDEPASVLLERIKAERGKSTATRKPALARARAARQKE